jgi:hypothetical protein
VSNYFEKKVSKNILNRATALMFTGKKSFQKNFATRRETGQKAPHRASDRHRQAMPSQGI